MHRGADSSLRDIDWVKRRWKPSHADSESKLHLIALAFAVARHWPDVSPGNGEASGRAHLSRL